MRNLVDYLGRQIRLTEERREHILSYPEMTGFQQIIEETLADPERVIASNSDPSVHLYYRFLADTMVGEKWVCDVVKSISVDPFVRTAYLTDRPKRGVAQWPKPNA